MVEHSDAKFRAPRCPALDDGGRISANGMLDADLVARVVGDALGAESFDRAYFELRQRRVLCRVRSMWCHWRREKRSVLPARAGINHSCMPRHRRTRRQRRRCNDHRASLSSGPRGGVPFAACLTIACVAAVSGTRYHTPPLPSPPHKSSRTATASTSTGRPLLSRWPTVSWQVAPSVSMCTVLGPVPSSHHRINLSGVST